MSVFLAPESWPFLGATLILVAITLLEGLSLLAGFSASHWLDGLLPEAPDGATGVFDTVLGWLHVGRIPVLILVVIFLAGFAVTGFTLNIAAAAVAGSTLPTLVAAPVAFIATLPIVRVFGLAAAHIIPKDETSAVSIDTLVGRLATIVAGTARPGFPAQARVSTEHGQTLYVMVEPDDGQQTFAAQESVLLVRRVSGTRFKAIPNPRPDLL